MTTNRNLTNKQPIETFTHPIFNYRTNRFFIFVRSFFGNEKTQVKFLPIYILNYRTNRFLFFVRSFFSNKKFTGKKISHTLFFCYIF